MVFLNTILDFIFPKKCLNCRENGAFLCFSCLDKIPLNEKSLNDYIISIFSYQNPIIKKAIWALKYKGKKDIAHILGEVLYDRLLEELVDLEIMENFTEPILIPIPLSEKKIRQRGFNQSEIIVRELVKRDVNKLFELATDILYKIKDTRNQIMIKDRKRRLNNLKDCFFIKNPGLVKGRNIIIFDDVVTTGATIKEARKTLKSAGAKKVIAFTLAH